MNERAATRRQPMFDYVTRADPALSNFGWKIVGLAHVAMVLPVIGAFFPREEPAQWRWIFVVVGIVMVVGAINLVSFTKMVRSGGYRTPPMNLVLVEVVLATVGAGVLTHAVMGPTGIYRPLIFVPTLLVAMIGNRRVIVVAWAVATAAVAGSAAAAGITRSEIWALVLSYGTVWGIAAVMVHLLAVTALHSDDQVGGLADLAGIAARSNTLEDGLAQVLPVVTTLAEATRAGAFRAVPDDAIPEVPDRFESLGRWSVEGRTGAAGSGAVASPPVAPPTATDIAHAQDRGAVSLQDGRAVILSEASEGDAVVVVIEGIPDRTFDRLMTRFNLERMAAQIDVLVNRTRYVARLDALGHTDGLTGLANRRSLFAQLERARAAARRRDEPLTVVMTDLDHFKQYNDTHGHLAGDDLLRVFAERLRERTRSVDVVARYGGEEFVLALPDTDAAGARVLLGELQRRFRADPRLDGVTFSAGVAVWDGVEDVESLIGRADTALYRAKSAGRDRSVIDPFGPCREDQDEVVPG